MSITSIGSYGAMKDLGSIRSKATVTDIKAFVGQSNFPDEGSVSQPSNKEMAFAVDNLNKVIASSLQSIQFSMDEELGKVVIKVMDTETKQVLRQIPNQEVINISKNLARLQGLVISDKA